MTEAYAAAPVYGEVYNVDAGIEKVLGGQKAWGFERLPPCVLHAFACVAHKTI
jgi:hypothetical protein